jgi:hypothetical protein
MSTSFLLILQVCSFLTGECKPPVEIPKLYNSWYECAEAGHVHGLELLKREGEFNINTYKLATKYGCYETNSL